MTRFNVVLFSSLIRAVFKIGIFGCLSFGFSLGSVSIHE